MENENITAAEGKPSGYKVTKKDLRNANWRWLMSVCTFNYQTQQGASVAYALSPILRKIYTNDEDYKQALNNHFRYYNTQPWLAAIILGACVAMEERDGLAAADAVQDLKIGTMGPLAGVGDSLLMTMIPTIMGSIAAYMAIEGNPVGAGIWFALILAIFWVRMHALEFGYKQGVKLVTDFSEKLPNLTAAASVLGLTVVGCLIASVIGVTCPISFSFGDVSMEIQPLLDKILPAMIPAAITGSAYYLLTKKNASMTALILVVIVLAMVASAAGILALASTQEIGESMRKIVVASHSLLAQGFKDTLEFLTGKSDAINAVCAYVNDNGEGLDAAVEAALSGTDEVVVLTDALGGSVNQRFSRFASDRIHVIAGVNLPLAMTVALARPDEKLDFDALVDEARQQIVYVNGASSAECEDDE